MRYSVIVTAIGLAIAPNVGAAQTSSEKQSADRMNRMIPLIEQKLPVLGINNPVYARGRGGGRGGRGGAAADTTPPPPIVMADVARETVGYTLGDFVLNSFSPNTVEQYREYMKAIVAAGGSAKTHPFAAKIPIMHGNETTTPQRIIDQLNEGQVGVEAQEVESVEEVNKIISAMRFTSKGGTRPESGFERAAAYWGMTPAQYLKKADVWPINPEGELLLGVIIESKPGIANARAIAAVPGVGVVIAGAGTLGGVFSSQDSTGRRVRDQAGFEAGVAAILAACKEYKKSCGYPANNPAEVEKLLKDGWAFLIMQRRDSAAFNAVLTGRRLSGRPTTPQ